MVSFSRFIDGQRGTQLLLDSDGFLYSRRKDRDTPTSSTWRCQKYRTKKCPSTVLLNTADQTLTSGEKPHTHEPGNLVAEKADFRQSLKRKAADQHLSVSATQNLLTEALANCPSELPFLNIIKNAVCNIIVPHSLSSAYPIHITGFRIRVFF